MRSKLSSRWQFLLARSAVYLFLITGSVVMAFPFFWMVTTAFKSSQEALQAQPVWIPERINPTHWGAAAKLGEMGGDGVWGGLAPKREVSFEIRTRDTGNQQLELQASLPGLDTGTSANAVNLFSSTAQTEPRELRVEGPQREGTDLVWTVHVRNTGDETLQKIPLRVNVGAVVKADLPADVVRRSDDGFVLEWSNIAPGLLGYVLENFRDCLQAAPFGRYFLNSAFTALSQTLLGLIVVSLAAFAFARVPFWGREVLFALVLSSLVIPGEMLLVPNYLILAKLGWTDTYQALIVPWIASVFGIFLLRQFFMSLPQELFEAARIDGAGYGTLLWRVALPLARPGLVTFSIFSFLGAWNALLWPLIVTNSRDMRTLQVGLQSFIGEAGSNEGQLMAASLIVVAPIIIGFFFAQRQFIAGVARSGLK